MTQPPESTSQFRKLSAIMFTDMAGYSRKMGLNEQATLQLLAEQERILLPLVRAFSGAVVKTAGDGVMASFDSAVNAVRCAIEIQRKLAFYNHDKADARKLLVRIGIHLGDVVVKGNDLFGDGVNIASRIEPFAAPGGICISQDVLHQIKNKVEIESISLGPRELKNIVDKVELYALVLDASRRPLTPVASGQARLWQAVAVIFLALALLVAALAWQQRGNQHDAAPETGQPSPATWHDTSQQTPPVTQPPVVNAKDTPVIPALATVKARLLVMPCNVELGEKVADIPILAKFFEQRGEKLSAELATQLQNQDGLEILSLPENPGAKFNEADREKFNAKVRGDPALQTRVAAALQADYYLRGALQPSERGQLRQDKERMKLKFTWTIVRAVDGMDVAAGEQTIGAVAPGDKNKDVEKAARAIRAALQPLLDLKK